MKDEIIIIKKTEKVGLRDISVLGKQRQEDTLSSLASQSI